MYCSGVWNMLGESSIILGKDILWCILLCQNMYWAIKREQFF